MLHPDPPYTPDIKSTRQSPRPCQRARFRDASKDSRVRLALPISHWRLSRNLLCVAWHQPKPRLRSSPERRNNLPRETQHGGVHCSDRRGRVGCDNTFHAIYQCESPEMDKWTGTTVGLRLSDVWQPRCRCRGGVLLGRSHTCAQGPFRVGAP